MTVAPELNARTGQLWLADSTFAVLVAHTGGVTDAPGIPPTPEIRDFPEQLNLLRAAGVLDAEDRPHDALSPALQSLAEQTGSIELAFQGRAMRGWVDREGAALLMPPGEDGRGLLTYMPFSLLPGALAKMADVRPSPRLAPVQPVPYEEGDWAGIRRHWRLSVKWRLDAGTDGQPTAVEVLDTDGGLWLLENEDGNGQLIAWPTIPTTVWRRIIRLVTAPAKLRTAGKHRAA